MKQMRRLVTLEIKRNKGMSTTNRQIRISLLQGIAKARVGRKQIANPRGRKYEY